MRKSQFVIEYNKVLHPKFKLQRVKFIWDSFQKIRNENTTYKIGLKEAKNIADLYEDVNDVWDIIKQTENAKIKLK